MAEFLLFKRGLKKRSVIEMIDVSDAFDIFESSQSSFPSSSLPRQISENGIIGFILINFCYGAHI